MKILFTSLGCDKNLVDTEMMLGLLEAKGHTFTDDEDEAEAVIVNTCCFIGDAKEESINTLLEFAERRKTGEIKALLACGCLAQRYRDEIQKEIPEVDAIVGTNAIKEIVEALEGVLAKAPKNYFRDLNAVTSIVPIALFQRFVAVIEAFPWRHFLHRRRAWRRRALKN